MENEWHGYVETLSPGRTKSSPSFQVNSRTDASTQNSRQAGNNYTSRHTVSTGGIKQTLVLPLRM